MSGYISYLPTSRHPADRNESIGPRTSRQNSEFQPNQPVCATDIEVGISN